MKKGNIYVMLFMFFVALTYSSESIAQGQPAESGVNMSDSDDIPTYGTFQFKYPNEVKLFWSIDKMASLYEEIEFRRQDEVIAYWYYSSDVTIIIY